MWRWRLGVSSVSILNNDSDAREPSLLPGPAVVTVFAAFLQDVVCQSVQSHPGASRRWGSEVQHSRGVAARFATRYSDVLWITLPLQRVTGPN